MPRRIRVFDIESTGTGPDDQVVEIAAVDVVKADDGAISLVTVGAWLVDPGIPIPPEASAVHHLVDEDVRGAPAFEELFPDPCGLTEDHVAVASHAWSFDGRWLSPVLPKDIPQICTYKAALRVFPEAPAHSNQVLRYWLGLDVKPDGYPHRALYDATVTAALFVRLLDHATPGRMASWTLEPALQPVCKIGKFRNVPWDQVDIGFLRWVMNKGEDFDADTLWNVSREIERRQAGGQE